MLRLSICCARGSLFRQQTAYGGGAKPDRVNGDWRPDPAADSRGQARSGPARVGRAGCEACILPGNRQRRTQVAGSGCPVRPEPRDSGPTVVSATSSHSTKQPSAAVLGEAVASDGQSYLQESVAGTDVGRGLSQRCCPDLHVRSYTSWMYLVARTAEDGLNPWEYLRPSTCARPLPPLRARRPIVDVLIFLPCRLCLRH